jgi:ketosteroid isomerase-like protein
MSKTIEQSAAAAELDPNPVVNAEIALKEITTGQSPLADILNSMLTSLSEGRIADFVAGFQSSFEFTDHALNLQFKEHQQLTEFLEKSRELFPDTVLEVVSVFQSGDAAIAEWKLTATQTVSAGSMNLRMPILLSGVSIAQFNSGKITRWTDYYDQLESRRVGLAAFFTEWIEY